MRELDAVVKDQRRLQSAVSEEYATLQLRQALSVLAHDHPSRSMSDAAARRIGPFIGSRTNTRPAATATSKPAVLLCARKVAM